MVKLIFFLHDREMTETLSGRADERHAMVESQTRGIMHDNAIWPIVGEFEILQQTYFTTNLAGTFLL